MDHRIEEADMHSLLSIAVEKMVNEVANYLGKSAARLNSC